MYTMVGRRCKNIFYNGMKFPDVFGVYPELEEDSNLVGQEDNNRMEPDQGYRKKEEDLDVLYPTKAEGNCEIECSPE